MADSRPTTLYRLFNARGKLLYMGISLNLGARFKAHSGTKAWWPQVSGASFSHYPHRYEAEIAEARQIQIERPRFNATFNAPPVTDFWADTPWAADYDPWRLW